MKRFIGFMANNNSPAEMPSGPSGGRDAAPVRSLARVRFDRHPAPLTYYNDRFDLQGGIVSILISATAR